MNLKGLSLVFVLLTSAEASRRSKRIALAASLKSTQSIPGAPHGEHGASKSTAHNKGDRRSKSSTEWTSFIVDEKSNSGSSITSKDSGEEYEEIPFPVPIEHHQPSALLEPQDEKESDETVVTSVENVDLVMGINVVEKKTEEEASGVTEEESIEQANQETIGMMNLPQNGITSHQLERKSSEEVLDVVGEFQDNSNSEIDVGVNESIPGESAKQGNIVPFVPEAHMPNEELISVIAVESTDTQVVVEEDEISTEEIDQLEEVATNKDDGGDDFKVKQLNNEERIPLYTGGNTTETESKIASDKEKQDIQSEPTIESQTIDTPKVANVKHVIEMFFSISGKCGKSSEIDPKENEKSAPIEPTETPNVNNNGDGTNQESQKKSKDKSKTPIYYKPKYILCAFVAITIVISLTRGALMRVNKKTPLKPSVLPK